MHSLTKGKEVMPNEAHSSRVFRVLDRFGNSVLALDHTNLTQHIQT